LHTGVADEAICPATDRLGGGITKGVCEMIITGGSFKWVTLALVAAPTLCVAAALKTPASVTDQALQSIVVEKNPGVPRVEVNAPVIDLPVTTDQECPTAPVVKIYTQIERV
jgi:hypothetical protein